MATAVGPHLGAHIVRLDVVRIPAGTRWAPRTRPRRRTSSSSSPAAATPPPVTRSRTCAAPTPCTRRPVTRTPSPRTPPVN
ncbi:hypothetical protein ACFQ2B_22095 [Streptomyces stramineus]